MATWREVERAAPELAAEVAALLQRGRHKTLATLRRDGSPRLSGTETAFADGELTLGMMGGSVKLADVRRDPRVALHSPSVDPPEGDETAWPGEAKLAGHLRPVPGPGAEPDAPPDDAADPGAGSATFALDVAEVVCTTITAEGLLVRWWTPGTGLRRAVRT